MERSKPCGAKAKSTGEPCKKPGLENGRCRLHGGLTPKGINSPHFKHGRFSRYLPDGLVGLYQEALKDEHLLSLKDEVALVEVREKELLTALGDSAGVGRSAIEAFEAWKAAVRGGDDSKIRTAFTALNENMLGLRKHLGTWSDLFATVETKRRLVESERKHLIELGQFVYIENVLALVAALQDQLNSHVQDETARRTIIDNVRRMVAGAGGVDGRSAN